MSFRRDKLSSWATVHSKMCVNFGGINSHCWAENGIKSMGYTLENLWSSPWKGALGFCLEGLTPRRHIHTYPAPTSFGLIPGKHVKANRKVNQSSNKQARLE